MEWLQHYYKILLDSRPLNSALESSPIAKTNYNLLSLYFNLCTDEHRYLVNTLVSFLTKNAVKF